MTAAAMSLSKRIIPNATEEDRAEVEDFIDASLDRKVSKEMQLVLARMDGVTSEVRVQYESLRAEVRQDHARRDWKYGIVINAIIGIMCAIMGVWLTYIFLRM